MMGGPREHFKTVINVWGAKDIFCHRAQYFTALLLHPPQSTAAQVSVDLHEP